MTVRFIALGRDASIDAAVMASAGDKSIPLASAGSFALGAPLFLEHQPDPADPPVVRCLGRLRSNGGGVATFAWALEEDVDGDATIFQPERWFALPPSLRPIEHVEYEFGLAERGTAGGTPLVVEREAARELLRLRLPAPSMGTLQTILEFLRAMREDGTIHFTIVDGQRRVRRVALAHEEAVAFRPGSYAAGEPFDLIARVDAEAAYA